MTPKGDRGEVQSGATRCQACGAEATAVWDDYKIHVVCDECGYELWGPLKVDGPHLAARGAGS